MSGKLRDLPALLDNLPDVAQRMEGKRLALFLDYDGTLAPIVASPEKAIPFPGVRQLVGRLAELCPVAIVSGRAVARLRRFLDLPNVVYAGSHGLAIEGPAGVGPRYSPATPYIDDVAEIGRTLTEELSSLEGALVEQSTFTVATHYRMVAPSEAPKVEEIAMETMKRYPSLKLTRGKMVLEIRPDVERDKGQAVLMLAEELRATKRDTLPIYIGDDRTDEDAFRALKGWGLAALVAEESRLTAAEYLLRDVPQTVEFLRWLEAEIRRRPPTADWRWPVGEVDSQSR